MENKRKISEKTRIRLYANSGNKCAMPGCEQELLQGNAKIGHIAHIEGLKKGSARYNENLSEEQVNDYENLILLCPTHHTEIDSKDNIDKYTVEYLKLIKKEHEQYVKNNQTFNKDVFVNLEKEQAKIIKKKFKKIFGDEDDIKKNNINECLEKILNQSKPTRTVLYEILASLNLSNIELEINMTQIFDTLKDIYDEHRVASSLEVLENLGYIKEETYTGGLESYIEQENGELLLVENNYIFKLYNGSWYFKLQGKILISIYKILKNREELNGLIINKEIKVLMEKIEEIQKKKEKRKNSPLLI